MARVVCLGACATTVWSALLVLCVDGEIASRVVFGAGEAGYSAFRIPAIVAAPQGSLLAFAEARLHPYDSGHIDVVMKRSEDGGLTWGKLTMIVGGLDRGNATAYGNPVPIVDWQAKKVILVYCVNNLRVRMRSSGDGGVTWSVFRDITSEVKRPGWGWMATGPGHGVQLKSGRLIVPFNTFFETSEVVTRVLQTGCIHTRECALHYPDKVKSWVTSYEISNPKDPTMTPLWLGGETVLGGAQYDKHGQAILPQKLLPLYTWAGDRSGVFFSDDHGETWHLGGMVNSRVGSSECAAAEVEAGLLLSFRTEDKDTGCRKMALSRDGGQSFEHFFQPCTCLPDPVCQASLLRLTDGRLLHGGPGSSSWRTDMTLFVTSHKPENLKFARLTLVAPGSGGYSDMVELPATAGHKARVLMLHERLKQFSIESRIVEVEAMGVEDAGCKPIDLLALPRQAPTQRPRRFLEEDEEEPALLSLSSPGAQYDPSRLPLVSTWAVVAMAAVVSGLLGVTIGWCLAIKLHGPPKGAILVDTQEE